MNNFGEHKQKAVEPPPKKKIDTVKIYVIFETRNDDCNILHNRLVDLTVFRGYFFYAF